MNFSKNSYILLDRFNSTTKSVTDQMSACHVIMIITYNNGNSSVTINYGQSINHSEISMEIATTIQLRKSDRSIVTSIDYVCVSSDLCDQIFVKTWTKWFLDLNHDQLQVTLISLLEYPALLNSCDLKQVEFTCESFFCFGTATNPKTFSHWYIVLCVDSPIYVYVTTQLRKFGFHHPHRIRYTCTKEDCEKNDTYSLVIDQLLHLYNLKALEEWLGVGKNRKQTTTMAFINTNTSTVEKHISITFLIKAVVAILFLVFALLIKYYLCRMPTCEHRQSSFV
jgi:hypothetical protein